MKLKYEKPELNAKAYAQFENVFAECTKSPGQGCTIAPPGWSPVGSSYSSHQALGGQKN